MAINNILKSIILDVYDHDKTPKSIKSIAADNDVRYIAAEIQSEGVRYDVSASSTVELIILRPDKVGVSITGQPQELTYETDPVFDPDTGETTPGETVTYYGVYAELDQAALAKSGTLLGQFKITSGNQVLRTELFKINNGRALDAETSEWADQYEGYNLDELVQTVNTAAAAVTEMEEDVATLKEDLKGKAPVIYNTSDEAEVATISDGAENMPMKSVVLKLVPHQEGTGDPSPENVRPISGYTAVKVTRTGKNILFHSALSGTVAGVTYTSNDDGSITMSGTATQNRFNVLAQSITLSPGTYVMSKANIELVSLCMFNPATNNQLPSTFTLTERTTLMAHLVVYNGAVTNATVYPMLRPASISDPAYEPYQGATYDITLPQTVYGGELDVTNGVLRVTHGQIASYSGQSINTPWISSEDVYESGRTPTTGAQVVYPLTTPTEITLDKTAITTLLGSNTIWMSADGTIQCDYPADTKMCIDALAAPFLDPDMFSGTDTEKLQSCLDMLSTTGGNILIRRRYQITANLVDKLNTETYKKKLITFIGIGQTAILNMGSYSFISDLSNAAIGGLKFINIDFEGIGQCFNTNKLIRLFFNNCRFYGFQYVIYGEGTTQSLYFTQCYFEGITLSVFINISNGVWNVVFTNCICENSNRFYDGDKDSAGQGNYNVVIRDCCIESITVPAIYLSGNSHTFIVSGCYFEAATPISLYRCGALSQNIIIENNIFFLSSDETGIIMPSNNSADEFCRGVISNNECVPATALLVKESNSSQSNPTRFRLVDNIGVIDSTLKLDTKITLTPTVYRSRIEILYQSCFMDGDEVHVNIRCKANQDFAGNTIITGLPTPSVAQYIGVNVSGAYIQATTSSATGIIADSIASGTVFVISGTYNV